MHPRYAHNVIHQMRRTQIVNQAVHSSPYHAIGRTHRPALQRMSILQCGFHGIDHCLIFGISQINLARIHLKHATIVGTIHIFGSQMEVQV